MVHSMRGLATAAAFAVISMSAGCVPLTEHKKLEAKFKEQETYIAAHKDEVKEFEKREQIVTMKMREQEKQNELLRTRLEKSERMRADLERGKPTTMPAMAAMDKPIAIPGGFRVNPASGGIILEHDILFSPGKSELKASGKKALDEIIAKLNGAELAHYAVRVDGHTDADPVVKSKGTNVDNWGLSAHRALVVLRYMETHGISSDRLFECGFGCQRPLDGSMPVASVPVKAEKHERVSKHGTSKKHTKHAVEKTMVVEKSGDPSKAQNRRVEIVLFEKK